MGRFYGQRSHATVHSAIKTPLTFAPDGLVSRTRVERILAALRAGMTVGQLFPVQGDLFPPASGREDGPASA